MKIVDIFVLFFLLTVCTIGIGINTKPTSYEREHVHDNRKEPDKSGTCGGVSWSFDDYAHTLAIYGGGEMSCFNSSSRWSPYDNEIEYIEVRDRVSFIEDYAFRSMSNLKTVNITSRYVTSIGKKAFYNCTNLITIIIPSSVKSIGEYAFSQCQSLKSITIPPDVSSINDNTFSGCEKLETVNITSSNLTSIGTYAFFCCKNLVSINIPSSVSSIGSFALYNCESLESITLPPNISSINDYTFSGCINMETVNITSTTIISIGNYAFKDCEKLTTIRVPSSVESIGPYAFSGCKSLTSITIPPNVSSINDYTFSGCINMETVNITSTTITSIGNYAFQGCQKLTTIYVPSSVESIGSYAFSGCESLTSITIPPNVSSINSGTFYGCKTLETVNIASTNLSSIGDTAFYNCRDLTSITIPSSVKTIGSGAFLGCISLESIIYLGSTEQSKNDVFSTTEQLKFVCLSIEYPSSSFCGLNQFCRSQSCDSFMESSNQCYQPVCHDGNKITMMKRDNATEWEGKTTGCYEFQCFNDSGPIYWKQCNKPNEVCENDQCVIVEQDTYRVVIEIEEIDVTALSMTEIHNTISGLTNVDPDEFRIRFEMNDEDEVIRIIVVVDDKKTADTISKSINEVIDECQSVTISNR